MKKITISLILLWVHGSAWAALNPNEFKTSAVFGVNGNEYVLQSALVTVEPHPVYAPEYAWMEINFYPFELNEEDIERAYAGDFSTIKKRRHETDYNAQATVKFNIDSQNKVTQVDIAMPGYSCTVASTQEEIDNFLEEFKLGDDTLILVSRGEYTCELQIENGKKWTHTWDINTRLPVIYLKEGKASK